MDTDTGDRASTSQIEMIEVMFFKIFFPSEQQSRDCFFEGGGGDRAKIDPPTHTHTNEGSSVLAFGATDIAEYILRKMSNIRHTKTPARFMLSMDKGKSETFATNVTLSMQKTVILGKES